MKNLIVLLLAFASASALAQSGYPSRPVRVLVGYPPGGGMDTIARIVAPRLAESLGQPFVIENRPGASGGVAAESLVQSAADGHTLLLGESGTLALPAVNPAVKLDPPKQFAAIGGVCTLPLAFVVGAAFPAQSTKELIAALKAAPGKHGYASPGVGTMQHLAFESFKRAAGVEALHVPYKGAAAMMPDIMSGQVPIAVISVTAAMGPARAGRIRALAVTTPQRVPSAPEWPTMAETLPGFSASPSIFLVGPAGTPPAVVERLSTALHAAVSARDVGETLAKQGAVPWPAGAAETAAQIAEETRRWAGVVREAGIRLE